MLTQPAYNERKWGEYPELRQVLENERIHDMTLISTDDTGLERCRRLIEIGILFTQNEEKIVNYVKNNLCDDSMMKDLDTLNDNMNSLIFELKNITDKIRDVEMILQNDM